MDIIKTTINERGELVQMTREDNFYVDTILSIGCLAAIDDPDSPEYDLFGGFGRTYRIARAGCTAWATGVAEEDIDAEIFRANQITRGHQAFIEEGD